MIKTLITKNYLHRFNKLKATISVAFIIFAPLNPSKMNSPSGFLTFMFQTRE